MIENKKLLYGILIMVGLVVIIIGFSIYQNPSSPAEEINSFEDCIKAGYPALESYPRQCKTSDGKIFVEQITPPIKPPKDNCEDLCGDGICQEVVCMAIGCPCPETPETCPEDCK